MRLVKQIATFVSFFAIVSVLSIFSGCSSTKQGSGKGFSHYMDRRYSNYHILIVLPDKDTLGRNGETIFKAAKRASMKIRSDAVTAASNNWNRNHMPYLSGIEIETNSKSFFKAFSERQLYFLEEFGKKKDLDVIFFPIFTENRSLIGKGFEVEIWYYLVDRNVPYPVFEKKEVSLSALQNERYWRDQLMKMFLSFYGDVYLGRIMKNSERFECGYGARY